MISTPVGLILVAVLAFAITYALVPVSMTIATQLGAIDEPGERRVHKKPTPRMGGIALFGGIMGALAIAFVLHKVGLAPTLDFPDSFNTVLIAISIVVIFAVGAIDDVVQIHPWVKLLGQIVASCIAVAGGVLLTDIHSGAADLFVAFGIWAYPITVFYLVAFANIINLIDGLDGLAAGVTAIAGAAFLVLSSELSIWATATMAVALVASCIAFLRFNFNPAKLFMGDCGSLTLGFILGMVSLMGTMRVSSITSLAVPVVIAAIPVLDTFAAIIRRKRSHVPIGSPDKQHLHHSLLRMGFSQKKVVLTIYAICAVFAVSGVVIADTPLWVRLVVVVIDLFLAAFLVWRLGLFGKVMGRYYPDGKPKNLGRTITEMKKVRAARDENLPEYEFDDLDEPSSQENDVENRQGVASRTKMHNIDSPGNQSYDDNEKGPKLRFLLLCEHYYPHVDACAKRMRVISEELMKSGHDVVILASETSLAEAPANYVVPDYVHFFTTFKMTEKTVIKRLRNNWSEKTGSESIAKELGEFDVVVVSSPPLMLALSGISIAKSAGAKLVFDVRDIWPDVAYEMGSFDEKSIYGRVFTIIANRAYRNAFLITTVSKSKAAKLRSKLKPGDAAKVRLVPNGLDLAFFNVRERPDLVRHFHLDDDPPCVYIGNLGLAQGLTTLLNIAKQRPNTRFLLFGSGAEQKKLSEEIKRLGLLNAKLCGRIDARGVRTLLNYAACAYVPLKNSNMIDSVPTKLYEALGSGCPVLLAAQGDSVEILKESGLGIACAPEDTAGLLAAFDQIMSKRWTIAERSYSREYIASMHSRQESAKQFENIILHEIVDSTVH